VLWMAMGKEGLFYRKGETWNSFDTPPELEKLNPTTAYTDDGGRVWFGYDQGTIIYLDNGAIRIVATGKDSPVGLVGAIGGRNQQIWIGGTSGLAFFDGKRFLSVVPSDAATFGYVSGMEQAADGGLWLREPRGVVHIKAEELHRFLETPTYGVHYELFDSLDGLPGRFEVNVRQGEALDSKGRLWFAATDGFASLDPSSIPRNSSPPQAAIRAVIVDGKRFRSEDDQVLPPLPGRLEIDYAGLNLSTPERVRLRYKLDGTDKDWQDAGTSRQAFYTNLAPGKHRFRLNARNVGGKWNPQDTVLEFHVAPAWFQTYWFFALCAAVAFFILWILYRMRLRQVANAMAVRFDERLSERTRIARDIHDTFLQTIQGSKLVADSALKQSADPVRMRSAMEQLSVWLGRATEEGRAALNSLRTSTTETNNLAEAFRRSIEECRIHSSLEASFSVVGKVSEMHPIVRDEVYRIGYEAIRNACVHSQAAQIQVELTYAEDLILRVRDNGIGIDPAVAGEGKEGHFGLQGMQERADRIVSKLTVESSKLSGTEIKLVVPGSIIYRGTISASKKLLAVESLLKRLGLKSGSSDS
jgi:signal transduction histidine kinase